MQDEILALSDKWFTDSAKFPSYQSIWTRNDSYTEQYMNNTFAINDDPVMKSIDLENIVIMLYILFIIEYSLYK